MTDDIDDSLYCTVDTVILGYTDPRLEAASGLCLARAAGFML
jgi:hypothetical protein